MGLLEKSGGVGGISSFGNWFVHSVKRICCQVFFMEFCGVILFLVVMIGSVIFALTFFSVPRMQFKDTLYKTTEKSGNITAQITRTGDLEHVSMVRCYTRQASAEVMMDYEERPDTNASHVIFYPGEWCGRY